VALTVSGTRPYGVGPLLGLNQERPLAQGQGRQELKLVYQSSINTATEEPGDRKQACQKADIDIELKSVVASV